jgi:murein DD-endopeptidase MepM/ murein hydrolase activator NlpD
MPDMPILGQPPRKNPVAPVAMTAVVIGLLAGVAYWWTHRAPAAGQPQATTETMHVPVVDSAAATATPGAAPPAATPTADAPAPATPDAPVDGLRSITVTIDGPLESAFIAAVGKDVGAPLTQVVTRALVWWVRVPQDLVKNDRLSVVYETRPGQEPVVHAVRFTSGKLGKTVEAYRYQAKGAPFARLYQPDGSELEERLADGPLDSYEQITSLLRDGRRHRGVDFKTPVGTPVKATFDGTITRKNWNFRANGNSLEIEEAGGQHRTAMFLHLSELPKSVQPGQRVKKGQVIAQSGNSGRSFAPHLHYQLMRGDTVLDPFESHATTRVSLPAADRPAFDALVARLERQLAAEAVAQAGR